MVQVYTIGGSAPGRSVYVSVSSSCNVGVVSPGVGVRPVQSIFAEVSPDPRSLKLMTNSPRGAFLKIAELAVVG